MSGERSAAARLGKVVWSTTMSLDGVIAGPDDAMDWVFKFAGPNPVVEEIIRTTGAVLAGRRSYEVGRKAQRPEMRKAFGGAWSGPQFVLTHRPHEADPDNTFLSGDIRAAVATALAAARGKNLNLIGANVAGQCLDAVLVDEIVVLIAPVLLGEGTRLSRRGAAGPWISSCWTSAGPTGDEPAVPGGEAGPIAIPGVCVPSPPPGTWGRIKSMYR